MKHVLTIPQKSIMDYDWNLYADVTDWCIIDYIRDWCELSQGVEGKAISGQRYIRINLAVLVESLPLLRLNTKQAASKRVQTLIAAGLLEGFRDGRDLYLRLHDNVKAFYADISGVEKRPQLSTYVDDQPSDCQPTLTIGPQLSTYVDDPKRRSKEVFKDKEKEKTKEKRINPLLRVPPEGVNQETWDAYLEVRVSKKAPMTALAYKLVCLRLYAIAREYGCSTDSIVHQSALNGWVGLFKPATSSSPAAAKPQTDWKKYEDGDGQ